MLHRLLCSWLSYQFGTSSFLMKGVSFHRSLLIYTLTYKYKKLVECNYTRTIISNLYLQILAEEKLYSEYCLRICHVYTFNTRKFRLCLTVRYRIHLAIRNCTDTIILSSFLKIIFLESPFNYTVVFWWPFF